MKICQVPRVVAFGYRHTGNKVGANRRESVVVHDDCADGLFLATPGLFQE